MNDRQRVRTKKAIRTIVNDIYGAKKVKNKTGDSKANKNGKGTDVIENESCVVKTTSVVKFESRPFQFGLRNQKLGAIVGKVVDSKLEYLLGSKLKSINGEKVGEYAEIKETLKKAALPLRLEFEIQALA